VTRLGERLDKTGRLGKQPIERTADAVAEMVDGARRAGALEIVAVGTAGLRQAPNRDAFLDAVEERTGIRPEVISGEEEARLSYRATREALHLGEEALADFETGGGSSQFTFGHGARVDEQFSVDVGAIRFTEQFRLDGPVDEQRIAETLGAIGEALAQLDGRPAPDTLVGMGGAVTNLAAVKGELAEYSPEAVRGTVLERAEVERQVELYRTRTADERRLIVGLQPKRAEIILAGACIVLTVMKKLGVASLIVSDRGLRHGLMVERFGAAR
jgi:exopolyphosphatase/guanosine-5'-triphosphate,3'-diphosphate pyrophosphatase